MQHEPVKGRVDPRPQDLFLVLEVEIDGTVGNIRAVRNVGDARVEKPLLGEHGNRGVEDALVLLGSTRSARNGVTVWRDWKLRFALHRESCSFPPGTGAPTHKTMGRYSRRMNPHSVFQCKARARFTQSKVTIPRMGLIAASPTAVVNQ